MPQIGGRPTNAYASLAPPLLRRTAVGNSAHPSASQADPAVDTTAPLKSELDSALLHSVAWTAGMKWLTQILSWLSTIIVARILAPSDYGLVAMATVFTGFVTLLSEFGLGTAVVTLRSLTTEEIAQLNTVALFIGVLSLGIGLGVAVPLSEFYGTPELVWIVVVLSTGFFINSFRTVPQALLRRDLRFKLLAFIDGSQAAILAVVMILLAILGLRYWTLVIGNLLSTAIATAAVVYFRAHRFAWPKLCMLKSSLTFSWHIIAGRVSWYTYSNADYLIAGRVLGKSPLGAYTLAWTLANIPVSKVTALVTQVTPAFFAAVQTDNRSLRRYLINITEALAFVTFPAAIGLALMTEEFVSLAFGQKWLGMVGPLRLLCLYAAFRSIVTLLPQVLNAIGDTRFTMWVNVLFAVVLPPAFYLATRWEAMGIAAVWLSLYPVLTLPLFWRVFRRIDLSIGNYIKGISPALSGVIVMTAAVLGVRILLRDHSVGLRFGVAVPVGAVSYGATLLILFRDRIDAFRTTLRALRSGPGDA